MTDHFPDTKKMVSPITPPPELLDQWANEYWGDSNDGVACGEKHIAIQAARWGADQQLKHCADWLDGFEAEGWAALQMCSDLRPKPPSLKEQALEMLECIPTHDNSGRENGIDLSVIRRALEQLDD